MSRARFVAAARYEFLVEVAYYNQERPGLGARFTAAVEEATARALAFPFSVRPHPATPGACLSKVFPYSLVYRPDSDGIIIFAVAHQSRRPGYWQRRIQEP